MVNNNNNNREKIKRRKKKRNNNNNIGLCRSCLRIAAPLHQVFDLTLWFSVRLDRVAINHNFGMRSVWKLFRFRIPSAAIEVNYWFIKNLVLNGNIFHHRKTDTFRRGDWVENILRLLFESENEKGMQILRHSTAKFFFCFCFKTWFSGYNS